MGRRLYRLLRVDPKTSSQTIALSSPAMHIYMLLRHSGPVEESKGVRKGYEWLNWGLETVGLESWKNCAWSCGSSNRNLGRQRWTGWRGRLGMSQRSECLWSTYYVPGTEMLSHSTPEINVKISPFTGSNGVPQWWCDPQKATVTDWVSSGSQGLKENHSYCNLSSVFSHQSIQHSIGEWTS